MRCGFESLPTIDDNPPCDTKKSMLSQAQAFDKNLEVQQVLMHHLPVILSITSVTSISINYTFSYELIMCL